MINSLSAVTWVDILKQFSWANKLSDATSTKVTKVLGVLYAAVGVGFAFVFTNVGGTILQMAVAVNGAIEAPLVGIYCLGCFFPWANWIGVFAGALVGFAFPMWINLGAYITNPDMGNNLGYSVDGCPTVNVTDNMTSYTAFTTEGLTRTDPLYHNGDEITGINKLYTLSYMYYSVVGIVTTIFVGLLVSFVTGYTHPSDIDPRYMMSYVDTFLPCFPKSCRQKATCGVQFQNMEKDDILEKELPDGDLNYEEYSNDYVARTKSVEERNERSPRHGGSIKSRGGGESTRL